MSPIEFTWDDSKDKTNQKKHKVSFREAQTVFYDKNARLIYDPDHSIEENRFILLGLSSILHILLVCHCYQKNDTIIRIISARKATKKEQNQYKENLP